MLKMMACIKFTKKTKILKGLLENYHLSVLMNIITRVMQI